MVCRGSSRTTYADFLTGICGYDPQLVAFFQKSTEEYFGVGIDATTALDAWGNWNPGFDGMDLGETPYKTMSPSGRLALTDPDDYIYHFPDGNAGVARSFVRALIPEALPGASMEDLVTNPVDYEKLDVDRQPGAIAAQRLGGTGQARRAGRERQLRDRHLRRRRNAQDRQRRPGGARLLAPRHPLPHRRAGRGSGRSAQRPAQGAADLHQRAAAQLGGAGQARRLRLRGPRRASGAPR